MGDTAWRSYEEVAVYLLDKIADVLGLDRVEGTQAVYGARSGTTWKIDGKGVKSGDEGFVIIECRRYTTSRQNQEKVGALAYRILDTGADAAILVSPLGFQEGAKKVAEAESILEVHMDPDSTDTEYFLAFLNQVFVGVSDKGELTDNASVKVLHTPEDPPAAP